MKQITKATLIGELLTMIEAVEPFLLEIGMHCLHSMFHTIYYPAPAAKYILIVKVKA